jgi:glucosamine--fructose-6-phosphate aminotransferase (isomerizing)
MCGIVGYTGLKTAYPLLLEALERLEYRGYDSCGIAISNSTGVALLKQFGFVENLKSMPPIEEGVSGIGHTRWATVGSPTEENAHPHVDCNGQIAIVHNGDITNYLSLRENLIGQGHIVSSDTDSEVIVHLIENYAAEGQMGSVVRALKDLEGSYALVVLFADSDLLIAARMGSPLVIGLSPTENFVASDVPAIIEFTDQVLYLEDGDVATVTPNEVKVFQNGDSITRTVHHVSKQPEERGLAGYEHYFLKEIHQQPKMIRDSLAGHMSSIDPSVTLGLESMNGGKFDQIFIAGCGSAYHASLIGEHFLSDLGSVNTSARIASEISHMRPGDKSHLGIFVTQSGETADTLHAARLAHEAGYSTLGLTNTHNSSISRITDQTIYTEAGLEISVAASKTFTSQLIDLFLIGLHLFPPPINRLHDLMTELRLLPSKAQQVLGLQPQLDSIGKKLAPHTSAYLVAKGINYPVALEASLKLKELAYLHAEALVAGELKHGPLALLTHETPVIVLAPKDDTYPRVLQAIREMRARGAPTIVFTDSHDEYLASIVDDIVYLPTTEPHFFPILATIALQLVAYNCARAKSLSIDRPRNLAKSVTVF